MSQVVRIVIGALFIVFWSAANIVWVTMFLMGTLMANDAGTTTNAQHMSLVACVLGGQVLMGLAGIPGGLAVFWRRPRKGLVITFVVALVACVSLQTFAFYSFFNVAVQS